MYPNPIVLNDGAADISYDYRGSGNESSSYKNASADLDQPQNITIGHQWTNKGTVNQARRTRIRLDRTVETDGVQGTIQVSLVLVVPEKVATTDQVTKEVTKFTDFLNNTGNIARIVNADL